MQKSTAYDKRGSKTPKYRIYPAIADRASLLRQGNQRVRDA